MPKPTAANVVDVILLTLDLYSGIIGSTVFLTREAPTYPTGFGVGLGLCWVTVAAATVLAWYIIRENRIRDNGGRDYRYELPEDEKGNLGDDHPSFRFML